MDDPDDAAIIGLAHGISAMIGSHMPIIPTELFKDLTVDLTSLIAVLLARHPEWVQWQVCQVIDALATADEVRLGYEEMADAVVEQFPVGVTA